MDPARKYHLSQSIKGPNDATTYSREDSIPDLSVHKINLKQIKEREISMELLNNSFR